MSTLFLNLALALAWAGLTGAFTIANLVVGYLIGYFAILMVHPGAAREEMFRRAPRAVGLVAYLLWELLLSSLRVAWDVLTPRLRARPAILCVPLDAKSDLEITALASLVTLTPGTLSLDVSEDRSTLYVHAMFVDDGEREIRGIKQGFERRLLELLR